MVVDRRLLPPPAPAARRSFVPPAPAKRNEAQPLIPNGVQPTSLDAAPRTSATSQPVSVLVSGRGGKKATENNPPEYNL